MYRALGSFPSRDTSTVLLRCTNTSFARTRRFSDPRSRLFSYTVTSHDHGSLYFACLRRAIPLKQRTSFTLGSCRRQGKCHFIPHPSAFILEGSLIFRPHLSGLSRKEPS